MYRESTALALAKRAVNSTHQKYTPIMWILIIHVVYTLNPILESPVGIIILVLSLEAIRRNQEQHCRERKAGILARRCHVVCNYGICPV